MESQRCTRKEAFSMQKIATCILSNLFVLSMFAQKYFDTTIQNVHYNWVKYDLNKNPYEIGQDYRNGIKNGTWIYRDQNGRITRIVNYTNDTLSGCAAYFEYLNDPIATKSSGLIINGNKVGEWIYEIKANRNQQWRIWEKKGILLYDITGRLISRSALHKNGTKYFEAFYDLKGEECYWKFFSKNGKLIRETHEYPYIIVAL